MYFSLLLIGLMFPKQTPASVDACVTSIPESIISSKTSNLSAEKQMEHLRQVRECLESEHGEVGPLYLNLVLREVDLLFQISRTAEAKDLLEKQLTQEPFPYSRNTRVDLLLRMVQAHKMLHDPIALLLDFKEANALGNNLSAKDRARLMLDASGAFLQIGQFKPALELSKNTALALKSESVHGKAVDLLLAEAELLALSAQWGGGLTNIAKEGHLKDELTLLRVCVLFSQYHAHELLVRGLVLLGKMQLKVKKTSAGWDQLEHAVEYAQAHDLPWVEAEALYERGKCLEAEGHFTKARADLTRSLYLARKEEMPWLEKMAGVALTALKAQSDRKLLITLCVGLCLLGLVLGFWAAKTLPREAERFGANELKANDLEVVGRLTLFDRRMAFLQALVLSPEQIVELLSTTDKQLHQQICSQTPRTNKELLLLLGTVEEIIEERTFQNDPANTIGRHLRREFKKQGWSWCKSFEAWQSHFKAHPARDIRSLSG